MQKTLNEISKFMSYALRHKPQDAGITVDKNGWTRVDSLIESANKNGYELDMEKLKLIVEHNNKKRFILSEDNLKIRANQGHTIKIDLQLKKTVPPVILYHGSAVQNINSILKHGLLKKTRHHVHLSKDIPTAISVGQRYGKPVLFEIDSKQMFADGIHFYLSENGVWLCDEVKPKYLKIVDHKKK
jgi:putative RNA 2'-phosphotransferase